MKESKKANVPHTKGPGTPRMNSIRMHKADCTAPVRAEPRMAPLTVACTDENSACLLYTSDAADERSSVDLGGRRIIKKKKNKKYACDAVAYRKSSRVI